MVHDKDRDDEPNMPNKLKKADIEHLLPWYVAGDLDSDERANVDAYLAQNSDLDEVLVRVKAEHQGVQDIENAGFVPTHVIWDGLADKMSGAKGASLASDDILAPSAKTKHSSLWQTVKDFFNFNALSVPQMAMAGAAAIMLVAQTGAIAFLLNRPAPQGYETASGPNIRTGHTGQKILLAFRPDVTISHINGLLGTIGGQIIDGPKADGLYILRIDPAPGAPSVTAENIEKIVARLKQRGDLIRFVTSEAPPDTASSEGE